MNKSTVLAITLSLSASCAFAADNGALAAAEARLRDAESVVALTAEGKSLYLADINQVPFISKQGNRALQLAEQGEFRQAIRGASVALFLGDKNRDGSLIAFAKLTLGTAYLYAGDTVHARQYATEALAQNVSNYYRGDLLSGANKILGDIALKEKDYPKAIEHYEKALYDALGTLRFYTRTALAAAFTSTKQFDKAGQMLKEAAGFVGVLAKPNQSAAESNLLRLRGEMALAQGATDEAIRLYQSAVSSQSARDDAAYERFWALEGLGRAKRAAGDRTGAQKAFLEAIDETEGIRSRFRSEEVKSGIFAEMQDVYSQTVDLLMETGNAELAWEVSERSRSRALLDMISNRVQLSSGKDAFADPFSKPSTFADIASTLAPSEVIVAYHVLQGRAYAWAIRKSGITAARISVDRTILAGQVRAYRDAVLGNNPAAKDLGARLHELVLKPLSIADTEAITFIPHDALHYLPFHALWAGDRYLIQKNPVSYAPSGGAYIQLMTRRKNPGGKLLAFGNPDLNDPALALLGAQREVEGLKAMFPDAEVFSRKEASRDRFVQSADKFGLVHVAAHGSVDVVDPLYSKLYLAAGPTTSGELEARDIYGLKLDGAALVVLSACETGLGRISNGDETWGFTRSFLSAGVPAIVVSLWPVADESTELLMKRFYTELKRGSDSRRALQSATLAVLENPKFSAPFFWAPFLLVGDSR